MIISPTIRKATQEDLSSILIVMTRVSQLMKHPDHFVADDEEFISRHISAEGSIALACSKNEVVGFQILRYPGTADDNLARLLPDEAIGPGLVVHMESSAVLPAYRGQRLQGELVTVCEEWAVSAGYQWSLCTVHPANTASLRNLERLSYRPLRRLTMYGDLDRLILGKRIPSAPNLTSAG